VLKIQIKKTSGNPRRLFSIPTQLRGKVSKYQEITIPKKIKPVMNPAKNIFLFEFSCSTKKSKGIKAIQERKFKKGAIKPAPNKIPERMGSKKDINYFSGLIAREI